MPQKRLTRADIFVFAVIIALTAVFLFASGFGGSGSTFTIDTPSGSASYSLLQDQTIEVRSDDITLTVSVSGGKVYVSDSHCPDHTCQQSGAISSAGEAIVCVPGRIVIKITEGGASDEDFIIG